MNSVVAVESAGAVLSAPPLSFVPYSGASCVLQCGERFASATSAFWHRALGSLGSSAQRDTRYHEYKTSGELVDKVRPPLTALPAAQPDPCRARTLGNRVLSGPCRVLAASLPQTDPADAVLAAAQWM